MAKFAISSVRVNGYSEYTEQVISGIERESESLQSNKILRGNHANEETISLKHKFALIFNFCAIEFHSIDKETTLYVIP